MDGREGGVVVTGAWTGIGRACALHLISRGLVVFAGVRNQTQVDALQDEASGRLIPVLIDVTDPALIRDAMSTVTEALGPSRLIGLVNNAGTTTVGPLELTDLDELRAILEVNVVGVVAVTQAFLPLLRLGQGRVVCIGSIGGRTPVPFLASYAASKAAVAAICDCLRVELGPWKIDVALIEPGSIATPIFDKALYELDRVLERARRDVHGGYAKPLAAFRERTIKTQATGISPMRVARVVEHALMARQPRTRYVVGTDAKMQAAIKLLPDRMRDWLIARYIGVPR
jgi:NAD(P)-dependent dehydrogenase (short-subunit alcohol dehydrogenase family)